MVQNLLVVFYAVIVLAGVFYLAWREDTREEDVDWGARLDAPNTWSDRLIAAKEFQAAVGRELQYWQEAALDGSDSGKVGLRTARLRADYAQRVVAQCELALQTNAPELFQAHLDGTYIIPTGNETPGYW